MGGDLKSKRDTKNVAGKINQNFFNNFNNAINNDFCILVYFS